ncbi:sugar transferase [Streptomyces sp. NBC_00094]|uniref:sugar transferase n=1 Tax=Streptomyces sp. NBC_00094 TaxID=2903620 RepID=UPI00225A0E8C|nr:sugar transferase [Streptomyces sp. NBC_00094]MCX5388869.1 sugar transferase [Streptomyces sp. NBC_00094]
MHVKRLIDVTGSIVLLLLAAPLFCVIALVIAANSPGGVIYRQVRVGLNGRPFEMLKFRTMRVGAHTERASLAALNETDGHLFKVRDDPRITPEGKWMRRLSLDELPQLVNVLRGEMSLVGPRPLLLSDSGYTGDARTRLSVTPGLTGLWQVSGRSMLAWEEMVRLDLHYVKHQSLTLDLAILVRTVSAVLSSKGAY